MAGFYLGHDIRTRAFTSFRACCCPFGRLRYHEVHDVSGASSHLQQRRVRLGENIFELADVEDSGNNALLPLLRLIWPGPRQGRIIV